MKTVNPRNRFNLNIGRKEKVLEVGGGHNPHPRSNMVVDKFIDSNYHRKTDIKVFKHQQFMEADGENLPFADKEYDYVICNQVLEHVENPEAFLKEQMRVASRGYIETPSLIGEYLFPKKSHKWLILELDNKLILMEKEKFWFQTNLDLGFLFLTWLQKTSMAYKLLTDTKPNFMTTRYEWKDSIEFEVNPENVDYRKYFEAYWDADMVNKFFPTRSKFAEVLDVTRSFIRINIQGIKNKLLVS